MTPLTLVIPCYNEADRLRVDRFAEALDAQPALHLLMVNDGSTDGTAKVLRNMAEHGGPRVSWLELPVNSGKAEAVRRGLIHAMELSPPLVGFWDADLATPLEEAPRFVEQFESRPALQAVLGSRVRLMGYAIERSAMRHYLGRIFATAASLSLNLAVYDTQCGAKVFRNGDMMQQVLSQPFLSRWHFDVEILFRLRAAANGSAMRMAQLVRELPLRRWHDVAGSKLKPADFARAGLDLWRMRVRYRRPVRSRESTDRTIP